MPKRFAQSPKKKSKNNLVVFIVLMIIVVFGVFLTFVLKDKFNNNTTVNSSTTKSTSENIISSTAILDDQPSQSITTEVTTESTDETIENNTEPTTQTNDDILVPGAENNNDSALFNATFLPYKAIDTYTDTEVSLKEVFGSSFSAGTVTFNDDGSFKDTLVYSSANSGAYSVFDNKISATYSNDKNMQIEVLEWNEGTPSEFIINYGGYDVYFN